MWFQAEILCSTQTKIKETECDIYKNPKTIWLPTVFSSQRKIQPSQTNGKRGNGVKSCTKSLTVTKCTEPGVKNQKKKKNYSAFQNDKDEEFSEIWKQLPHWICTSYSLF